MRDKHGGGSLMRDDEEFVLAPTAEMLRGAQTLNQSRLYFCEHGFACAGAVGSAQVVSLIDADPKDPKGWSAADVIVDQVPQMVFEICPGRFHRFIFAGVTAGKRIELVSGMEEDAQPDAPSERVAEDKIANDQRYFVSQLVADSREKSPWLGCAGDFLNILNGSFAEEGLEVLRDRAPHDFDPGVPTDGDGCLIPKGHFGWSGGIPMQKD
jgi:hypothetical protein